MDLRSAGPVAKEEFEKSLCTILRDRANITVTVVRGFPHDTHEARVLYWVLVHPTRAPAIFQLCLDPADMDRVRPILADWLPRFVRYSGEAQVRLFDCGWRIDRSSSSTAANVNDQSTDAA